MAGHIVRNLGEVRRLGITELIAEIQQANPWWSFERCRTEAKVRWHAEVEQCIVRPTAKGATGHKE